jgi:hypothetical protein
VATLLLASSSSQTRCCKRQPGAMPASTDAGGRELKKIFMLRLSHFLNNRGRYHRMPALMVLVALFALSAVAANMSLSFGTPQNLGVGRYR